MSAPLTKIVVLGANGFIGQCAHRFLANATDCETVGHSSQQCNLLDLQQAAEQLRGCDSQTSVVFCSAISRTIEDSWDAMQKNIAMVHNFLEVVRKQELRSIVFLSSTDVYGIPTSELPIHEQTPPQPDSYYGISKLVCERLFTVERPSCPVTILRLPGIYGPTDDGHSVIGQFIAKLKRGERIEITGDGETLRDYVHVEDLGRVIHSFINCPCRETINIATGVSISINALVATIVKELGIAADVRSTPELAMRDHDLVFDTRLLQSLCNNFEFKLPSQGIQDYLSAAPSETEQP